MRAPGYKRAVLWGFRPGALTRLELTKSIMRIAVGRRFPVDIAAAAANILLLILHLI